MVLATGVIDTNVDDVRHRCIHQTKIGLGTTVVKSSSQMGIQAIKGENMI
jgi:hypothetical protein